MNTTNPLIPQGTLLDQKNKGRARVRLAVFFVLTVHVIGLMALLMQGCKRDAGAEAGTAETNSPVAQTFTPTNPPADTTLAAGNALPPPMTNETPALTSEYVVQRGDSFYTIGKKFGVSIKAIQDANPTVHPTKLQLGQKLQIPPPTRAEASAAPVVANGSGGEIYVVKSGDTLSKIATDHGTTVKAIRAANNLVTDKIKVGDKLKLPKASAPPPATAPTSSPADAAPSNPSPAPGTAPPPAR